MKICCKRRRSKARSTLLSLSSFQFQAFLFLCFTVSTKVSFMLWKPDKTEESLCCGDLFFSCGNFSCFTETFPLKNCVHSPHFWQEERKQRNAKWESGNPASCSEAGYTLFHFSILFLGKLFLVSLFIHLHKKFGHIFLWKIHIFTKLEKVSTKHPFPYFAMFLLELVFEQDK